MRLLFTPEFRESLDRLFESIRDQSGSPSVARRVVYGIISRISILESYPDAECTYTTTMVQTPES